MSEKIALKKGFLESIGAKFFTDKQGRKRVIEDGEAVNSEEQTEELVDEEQEQETE